MERKKEKKKSTFEKEYNIIMKDIQDQDIHVNKNQQWTSPNDFIIKFSLYKETPNSITSTDTSINFSY